MGSNPGQLTRQSDQAPLYKDFVENGRWVYQDVLFLTLHVVGSNNGWTEESVAPQSEFNQRLAANKNWLETNLLFAEANNVRAVVIAFHAEINPNYSAEYLRKKTKKSARHSLGHIDGYAEIRKAIKDFSLSLDLPVLQLYGDDHQFKLFMPYPEDRRGDKVMRLQTFGAPNHRAVRISISNSKQPFMIEII